MYLLDTNIISEALRRAPNSGVLLWLESNPRTAISVVTLDEIIFGLTLNHKPSFLVRFEAFLETLELIEISALTARRAAQMRGSLAAAGKSRTQADMFIAATAQVHGLTLVTRNLKVFEGCAVALLNPFSPPPVESDPTQSIQTKP